MNAELDAKCRSISLLLVDVDGVLTDGTIIYDNNGVETKRFFVRDGHGIKLWQRSGGHFGIVTARNSHVVEVRAAELGVRLVRQGVSDKLAVVRQLAEEQQVTLAEVAYIGDDLPDLAVVRQVGLGVAVADAVDELRAVADYVTHTPGGRGAVREVVEQILRSQHRWDDLLKGYHP